LEVVAAEVVDDDVVNDRLTLSLSLWEVHEAASPTPITESEVEEEAMVSGLVAVEFCFVASPQLSLALSSPSSGVFILSSLLSILLVAAVDEEELSMLLSFPLPFLSLTSVPTSPRFASSSSATLLFFLSAHFGSCSRPGLLGAS